LRQLQNGNRTGREFGIPCWENGNGTLILNGNGTEIEIRSLKWKGFGTKKSYLFPHNSRPDLHGHD